MQTADKSSMRIHGHRATDEQRRTGRTAGWGANGCFQRKFEQLSTLERRQVRGGKFAGTVRWHRAQWRGIASACRPGPKLQCFLWWQFGGK